MQKTALFSAILMRKIVGQQEKNASTNIDNPVHSTIMKQMKECSVPDHWKRIRICHCNQQQSNGCQWTNPILSMRWIVHNCRQGPDRQNKKQSHCVSNSIETFQLIVFKLEKSEQRKGNCYYWQQRAIQHTQPRCKIGQFSDLFICCTYYSVLFWHGIRDFHTIRKILYIISWESFESIKIPRRTVKAWFSHSHRTEVPGQWFNSDVRFNCHPFIDTLGRYAIQNVGFSSV